jgi:hypothetical protein
MRKMQGHPEFMEACLGVMSFKITAGCPECLWLEQGLLKQELWPQQQRLQCSLQLEYSFLKLSMKCSKHPGCHNDGPISHQKRGCSVDNSLLKAVRHKWKIWQLSSKSYTHLVPDSLVHQKEEKTLKGAYNKALTLTFSIVFNNA